MGTMVGRMVETLAAVSIALAPGCDTTDRDGPNLLGDESGESGAADDDGSGPSSGGDPTDGGETGNGDSAGDPAGHCWDSDPTVWTVSEIPRGDLIGDNPVDPSVSRDGLGLLFMAGPSDDRRLYRSIRDSRATGFSGGTVQAHWEGLPGTPGFPTPTLDGAELLLHVGGDLWVSRFSGAQWDTPSPLPGPVNTPDFDETLHSLTADGSRLIVQRNDGPPLPPIGDAFRLHEARRPQARPGAAFEAPTMVDLPAITDQDVAMCPALSPEGQHLFFGSNAPEPITEDNIGHVLKIWHVRRDGLDDPWEDAVAIDTLSSETQETCPSSVTADGCELVFHRFTLGEAGTYGIHVARREP